MLTLNRGINPNPLKSVYNFFGSSFTSFTKMTRGGNLTFYNLQTTICK
jgi:hypothetical protein